MTGGAESHLPYWRLSVFYMAFFALTGAMVPFLPPFVAARGLTPGDIGVLLAIMTVAKVVAPNLWGYLADRSGRRLTVVRAGVAGSTLAVLGLLVPGGFWWLAFVLGCYGVVSNAVLPQFEVVTLNHLGTRSGDYARIRLWGSIGFIASVSFAGWWTAREGLEALPALLVTLTVLLALCALAVPSAPERPDAADGPGPIRTLVLRPEVAAFLLASLLMAASHGPYYAFFTIHLESLGLGGEAAGALWALAVAAEVLLFLGVPRLLNRMALRDLLLWCFALTATRWLLMSVASDWLAALVLGQLLHAVSFGLFHACAIAFVRARFGQAAAGRGQALYSSVSFGLGGALGALGAGAVWQPLGARGSFALAAAACLLAFIVVVLWVPRPGPGARLGAR